MTFAVVLADAAPSGAGLAIVAMILLGLAAVVLGVFGGIIALVVRSSRRRKAAEQARVAGGHPDPAPR